MGQSLKYGISLKDGLTSPPSRTMKIIINNNSNNNNGKDGVKFPNLIPYLAFDYRTSMLRALKEIFLENLSYCVKLEQDYCRAHNLQPLMTQEKIDQIVSILNKCSNVYEIQALNDYVFLENYVPTWEEVKQRGLHLKLLYPLLESARRPLKIKGQKIKVGGES